MSLTSSCLKKKQRFHRAFVPELSQGGVIEDNVDDTGTVDRRVRVHRTDDNFELRLDGFTLARVAGQDGQSAGAFAVEAKVLGKRLRQHQRSAGGGKGADRLGVPPWIATGKALIGHVEEGKVLFFLKR